MKSISIRFTDEQKKELEKAARKDGRSINSFVVKAVGDKVQKDEQINIVK